MQSFGQQPARTLPVSGEVAREQHLGVPGACNRLRHPILSGVGLVDCRSVVFFGARPIAGAGGGDAGGCSKQVLTVDAERTVGDEVFGVGFHGARLFQPPQQGESFDDEHQASAGAD